LSSNETAPLDRLAHGEGGLREANLHLAEADPEEHPPSVLPIADTLRSMIHSRALLFFFPLPALLALAACKHTLSPAAEAVLYTEDKASVANCQALGKVSAESNYTVSAGGQGGVTERRKRLRDELREKAAEKGGNMILYQDGTSTGVASLSSTQEAEVYKCPQGASAAPAPADAGGGG
jgi:hypothetical protein